MDCGGRGIFDMVAAMSAAMIWHATWTIGVWEKTGLVQITFVNEMATVPGLGTPDDGMNR